MVVYSEVGYEGFYCARAFAKNPLFWYSGVLGLAHSFDVATLTP